jgi:mono/diheme cytochrome c family protein
MDFSVRLPVDLKPKNIDFKCFPLCLCASVALLVSCHVEVRKTDAQLGLTPQQTAGRRVYDAHCDRCHEPYSSRSKKGRTLKGVFKKQYLPQSGLPANDQQVGDIIRYGRNMMPSFGQELTQQQVQALLDYLHTL